MFSRRLAHLNRRLTNHILRPLAYVLPPFAVVEHRGRTSDRRYRTPVFAFHRAGEVVIVLSYGRRSDWVRNVVAGEGGGLVRVGRRRRLARPEVVPTAEAGPLSPLGRFSCRFAEHVLVAGVAGPEKRAATRPG